jgi:hypothetical protein
VWADISAKASRMEAPSATQAMAEIFDRHRTSLESFVEALTPGDEQIGGLFAIGSEIVGLDLFDRRTTLAAMLPKLVRSYAIDAIDSERVDDKAVGLGTDLRLRTPGIVGGALAVDGILVHLAAFAVDPDAETSESDSGNLARLHFRRRSYGRR